MNILVKELRSLYTCPDFKGEKIKNLLAIIFSNGKPTGKARKIADKLLSNYKNNLITLSRASAGDLTKIIGENNTKKLLAGMEFYRQVTLFRDNDVIINSPEDAANLLMEEMRYYKKEVFKVILLNTKNIVIKIDTISIGTIESCIINAREVFYSAIKEMASSILLVHNHPCSTTMPGPPDIQVTKKLIAAGKTLGIDVVDHIIISNGTFFSMRDTRLFSKIFS